MVLPSSVDLPLVLPYSVGLPSPVAPLPLVHPSLPAADRVVEADPYRTATRTTASTASRTAAPGLRDPDLGSAAGYSPCSALCHAAG